MSFARERMLLLACAVAAGPCLAGGAGAQPLVPSPQSTPGVFEPLANSTSPGELIVYTTLISAGFEWRIAGDDDGDCTVALDYRKIGDVAWRPAQPLMRVEHGLWTHGEDPGNLLAGSLFFLQPATAYEARLTLSDPDGGSAQRAVGFTTRSGPNATPIRTRYVTPGSGGGSGTLADPFRGLAAADAAAQPGDLFIVQAGTYHGAFRATRDGTPANPIVYRGVDPAGVVVDGDGGASTTSHCVNLRGRRHVSIESMSLINCLRPVNADSSVGAVVRGCTIRPLNQILSIQGIRAAYSRDMLIANNTLQMTGQWATIGRTGSYGTGGYAILIEGTGHVICHNTIVESWDAVSIPATGTAVPACTTSNVDVYENFVDRASDDGVQADAVQHNVRIFRNRLLNTGSAVSFQPSFGGPGYVLFNELYNSRIEPYKMHQETFYGWTQETSGFVVMHNTSVCSRNGWLETGIWRRGIFRDNLLLGGRLATPTFQANYTYAGASFDADGYNRVNGHPVLVRYSGADYPNLPAFYAGTGNEQHGIEVGVGAFVNAALPHHPEWNYTDGYGAAYTPEQIDLRLASGSAAIDRGLALANVDDAFAGAAPDLGCYESGASLPAYGARPAGQPLGASAAADRASGNAPLTVRFNGTMQNARGVVVGHHWDFGDGTGGSDELNPVHTYLRGGPFTAVLTVTDDDGAVAKAGASVVVTGPVTDATAAGGGVALSPAVPNPFGASTTIPFTLAARSLVSLRVYDVRGSLVRVLANGTFAEGGHSVVWDGRAGDGRAAGAGVYFVRLSANDLTRIQRIARVR